MRIVFLEPIGMRTDQIENVCRVFEDEGHDLVIYSDRTENEAELIQRAKGADIAVISNIPLKASFFKAVPSLKYLSVAFAGVDHIDMAYCNQHGIQVRNAAGYSTQAVAELALGLMIDQLRQITHFDQVTRRGGSRKNFLGKEICGKTAGIIGLGAIGIRVAQLLQAFGAKVIAYNRSVKHVEGVTQVSLDELLQTSDILTIHTPLTAETRNMIDASAFQKMKPTAILVNTARGAVIDQQALVNALETGKIAGAAIDVYPEEPPLPETNPLLGTDHSTLLPHIGYATEEAFEYRLEIMAENIAFFLKQTDVSHQLKS